jgi:hypothetical protein
MAVGFGSALLVLASGVLLGAIALVWASVRTLSGDAPLAAELAVATPDGIAAQLDEEKRRLLRALKDLETEHALGRVDDVDYEALVARHRQEAKAVMRQLDAQLVPAREEAERIARQFLERTQGGSASTGSDSRERQGEARVVCGSCGISNEKDAAFCKSCGGAMKRADAS